MGKVLGISAYYHDSASALVIDGSIVAAAQEERFTRIKHDYQFPARSVEFVLNEAGIEPEDLDHVVFYDKPFLKFDRLLETYLAYAPAGFRSFGKAIPLWLKTKLHLPREIRKSMNHRYQKRIAFTSHHESHAASAFFISPFKESAILTMDGVGEWETATIGYGTGNKLRLLKSLHFPHSLGLLYSAFTYYCGFKVNSGEYKLMGLAPYGEPKFANLITKDLIDLKEDGSMVMNMDFFNYCQGLTMTSPRFHKLFGGPPRDPESRIEQRHMDLAASIQKVTEKIVIRMARHAKDLSGSENLCLAGGVALNCVANGELLRSGIFERIFITPASGDAGGALGAALFLYHQLLDGQREIGREDVSKGSLLGPRFSDGEVREFLDESGIPYQHFENEADLLEETAREIANQQVIGWFYGRMEFGPRALGARSIIGDARSEKMQSHMNLRIKFRESFRPFAPSVLAEEVGDYFEIDCESPYMLLVAKVKKQLRRKLTLEQQQLMKNPDLRRRVNIPRSSLPAITHIDMSARVQTVDEKRHGRYYRLIREFKKQTGCGVITNTSFNIRGEPIVCTPQDAYRCFMATDMDLLIMENCMLRKAAQPAQGDDVRKKYIETIEQD